MPDRRREKETRKVFSTTPFFVLSFPNQNPRQRERASFCASSFFFLLARSIHSSHFSLVARARVYIYIYISKRAISTRFTRETRREKEREGKKTTCTRDDDPGGKREEEERKIESFFRSGRLSESERRREKEREETRLSSSFQTL